MSRTRNPNPAPTSTTTTTEVDSSDQQQATQHLPLRGTLRLRGETAETTASPVQGSRRIRWAEDVVDNEGQGKKSSKVCCIYHKPREVGESSSESDSSSSDSDSSDSDVDNGEARMSNRQPRSYHHHDGEQHNGHQHGRQPNGDGNNKARRKKPPPNAYERVPKNTKKGKHV